MISEKGREGNEGLLNVCCRLRKKDLLQHGVIVDFLRSVEAS